jgi:hypothetical protein
MTTATLIRAAAAVCAVMLAQPALGGGEPFNETSFTRPPATASTDSATGQLRAGQPANRGEATNPSRNGPVTVNDQPDGKRGFSWADGGIGLAAGVGLALSAGAAISLALAGRPHSRSPRRGPNNPRRPPSEESQ